MKTPLPWTRQQGAALVVILAFLVVLLGLTLGFLAMVSTERQSSSIFANNSQVRNLADAAVNFVQAQINDATTLGTDYLWASQPGMIRTYDAAGSLYRAYKLYSAPDMVSDSVSLTADVPPAGWKSADGLWVDINEPVLSADDKDLIYPILNPDADKAVDGLGAVEGFSITPLPGFDAAAPEGAANNRAAMPVRWLYMLQDGQLVQPAGISDGVVRFDTAGTGPSPSNPIVGRLAFWTDDETAKVNINTAGEGTAWDTPRANSNQERQLGHSQPANTEWQRYPGHPATTSLSAVFPWQSGGASVNKAVRVEQSLSLTPYYRWGGSKAGTVATTPGLQKPGVNPEGHLYASVDELLFAPVRNQRDFFQADRADRDHLLKTRRFFLTAHSRAPETNPLNLPKMAVWPVFKLSNPADPNSFDMMRTTGFDRQIARCATIGGLPYYFQRENANSTTSDLVNIARNLQLYDYLDALTARPIPGYGGNFSSKYGKDRLQLLTSIFDYIRCTNLYDDLLDANNPPTGPNMQFTARRTDTATTTTFSPGHGAVAPLVHPTNDTKGFGRFWTLSELGLLFICTADPDPGLGDERSNFPPWTAGQPPVNPYPPTGTPVNWTLDANTPLTPGQRRIQAALLLELFTPSLGWTQTDVYCQVVIRGLQNLSVVNASGASQSLGFPPTLEIPFNIATPVFRKNQAGGTASFRKALFRTTYQDALRERLVSDPITIDAAGGLRLNGATVTVEIFAYPVVAGQYAQRLAVDIPGGTLAVPKLAKTGTPGKATVAQTVGVSMINGGDEDPDHAVGGLSMKTEPENWWGFLARTEDISSNSLARQEARRLDLISNRNGLLRIDGFSHLLRRASVEGADEGSGTIIRGDYDVAHTVYPRHGDYRLTAAKREPAASEFGRDSGAWSGATMQYHFLADGVGVGSIPGFQGDRGLVADVPVNPLRYADIPRDAALPTTGDFDNGISYMPDGPYINKPDEGSTYRGGGTPSPATAPYFHNYAKMVSATSTFFSPNRMMPSPVMFGSLPSGVWAGIPWQTLLFRPQPGHFGHNEPKDHLLLEFFWMPVVEPFAVSEPFSTAGRINMNYQIIPFTNIERSTGLHAVLKNEEIGAIPNQLGTDYKTKGTASTQAVPTRFRVEVQETLEQFTKLFAAGEIFKTASEICDIHLVPSGGVKASGMDTFWSSHRLTGDNTRERPYANIYPRLTTKSNTFTVHVRTQQIKKSAGADHAVFDPSLDRVGAEYRGSTIIERYINPNNPLIPDYAANTTDLSAATPLDAFYRWRVVQNRQFLP